MTYFSNLSIRSKLASITAFLVLLIVSSSLLSQRTIDRVKVTGPVYSELADSKDLLADILPPPAYIIESLLAARDLVQESDAAAQADLIQKLADLEREYHARLGHWEQTLDPGELQRLMLGEARDSANQYFDLVNQQLIPAVRSGQRETASALVQGQLAQTFAQHRAAILEVVQAANDFGRTLETQTAAELTASTRTQWAISLTVIGLIITVLWFTSSNATRRLESTRQIAIALSEGRFSERHANTGGDEIDQMGAELGRASQTLDTAFSSLMGAMEAATCRDFSKKITQELPGDLNRAKLCLNSMLDMLRKLNVESEENRALAEAVNKSQAVIEFDMSGRILTANKNFLSAVGYSLDEIQGKHHSIFVEPGYAGSSEYRDFWARLNLGQFDVGEYRRLAKDGSDVWIQASYNPIVDEDGKPCKVVKYASDITAAKKLEFAVAERQKADTKAAAEMQTNVAQILDVANRVSRGDYSVEIMVTGDDGIGQLGKGLQQFFADKKIAEDQERQRSESERREAEVQRRKVNQILDVVNAVAEGNFEVAIPDLGDDAVGQVATALKSAVGAIRNALLEVRAVAETVTGAAAELTSASTEISRGAQHQASSLEETASSLEEITSTVKQNTDNAQQARQLANGSRDIADKGGAVVGDAVRAMSEINQASTRIADIITTIDEIAFQTNLLALNAAVEAARAGEQGRGFAVVAAEVRNLAQRSASAAKEIKTLIQDSVRKVENGTSLVNQSGKTLEEIVGSVKRVTDIVAEIAAASKEQLTGIEQVNRAVAQMDHVTQNNASQTEEMSGTATSLLQHAEQLREAVRRFSLGSSVTDTPSSYRHPVASGNAQKRASANSGNAPTRSADETLDQVSEQIDQLIGSGYIEF